MYIDTGNAVYFSVGKKGGRNFGVMQRKKKGKRNE